ncbi:MAG: hypothetical protein H0T46_23860 [Deltaproteobacteria bacterium]|nr:hypothetical protein [Deltaproteobacteria bacterium]
MVALALALLIAFPNTKATLELPDGWKQLERPTLVAAYESPGGALLAVTRTQVPNSDAWRTKKRDTYVAEVARGALASAKGAKETARKLGDANGVPTLDLELRRPDGSIIVLRYLLFRTYALALAIELPKGTDVSRAHAIARSFAPPKPE